MDKSVLVSKWGSVYDCKTPWRYWTLFNLSLNSKSFLPSNRSSDSTCFNLFSSNSSRSEPVLATSPISTSSRRRWLNAEDISSDVDSISWNSASIRTAERFLVVEMQSRLQTFRLESRRSKLEDERRTNLTKFGKVFGWCGGNKTLSGLLYKQRQQGLKRTPKETISSGTKASKRKTNAN